MTEMSELELLRLKNEGLLKIIYATVTALHGSGMHKLADRIEGATTDVVAGRNPTAPGSVHHSNSQP
jgi:hypothetical protein